MNRYPCKVRFREFPLKGIPEYAETVVIPTVKGNLAIKYGKHAYYFYNFSRRKCLTVEIRHWDIIKPGLALFVRSVYGKDTLATRLKMFFNRFHYGFSLIEQIMLLTVPHAVTVVPDGKFLINLWAYAGYFEVDCSTRRVTYLRAESQDDDHVLGSQQWVHKPANELYYITYSLPESMKRISLPTHPVPGKIIKRNLTDHSTGVVWQGLLADYLHDIMVDRTGRYCVACELGMFQNKENNTIPSKVLIVDMHQNRHWIIEKFIVAAHAQFDPVESDIIYFSHHNFKFIPTSLITLLKDAIYSLKFTGPAAVYKYRLTPEGPKELAVFTEPDMFRLTNFHVFVHRGKTVVAAMGFPNFIYLADAHTMRLMKRLTLKSPVSYKFLFRTVPCVIGTFSPSLDGERLYVQTTRSFQILDIASGEVLSNTPLYFNHTAANHMLTALPGTW